MNTLTILADENITKLSDFLKYHPNITLIQAHGRTLLDLVARYRPDALFVRSVTPIHDTLAYLPRFVASATLGTDHIDEAFLAEQGIGFAHAAGSSKHTVAQYVLTAILTLRPQAWHKPLSLGIVGLGNIGTTLAHYAEALGWQVVSFDPFLPKSPLNQDFLSVLKCDVVSIHTPLTTTGSHPTHHLFDSRVFGLLNKDTLVINAARGKIIDETALMDFLATGGQAVLDVYENEPCPKKHLIDALALATPHIAGHSIDAKLRGTQMVYESFCRYFDLPILASMGMFLPHNPYYFANLNSATLADFYDIKKDDHALRSRLSSPCLQAQDFDDLRRHTTRREWQFEDTI